MKENIKGFWRLICLMCIYELFIAGIKDLVHCLAMKAYLESGIAAILTGLFFWLGVANYGALRNHMQKENKDG